MKGGNRGKDNQKRGETMQVRINSKDGTRQEEITRAVELLEKLNENETCEIGKYLVEKKENMIFFKC